MSVQIEIDGIKMLSLKLAAKQVSYSRDYISKLARDKKIVATQVGRHWFIDIVSLERFIDSVNLEQSIRKHHLSHERRRELNIKQEVQSIVSGVNIAVKLAEQRSLFISAFVMLLGFFVGGVIYSNADINSYYKNIWINQNIESTSLVAQTAREVNLSPEVSTLLSSGNTEYPIFFDESETRDVGMDNGGVFLLSPGSAYSDEDIKKMFSDPVKIEYTGENAGIISYQNQDGEIMEYPFVSVPTSKKTLSNAGP
ncbi:MAG: helix-turn-helix domain-containing protein [Candidatus Nomurabacteria bacterium]|nr:helix-turn-helix domain-containing protein [Candidatus Nomurabacteria bacterium]USN88114.1 MAG: helix-turn-helix domain-containing protein [Candidatus Nomurabacteria bacterium]